MGRSDRETAERNRAKVIEMAARLFRQHGVDAVSIADIMTAAGLTQGGFYKQFDSKDALATEACSLAFNSAADSWEKFETPASGHERAAIDLAHHYLGAKPAERACPMVSFNQEASVNKANKSFGRSYAEGVKALFELFVGATGSDLNDREARERNLVLFASLVGANVLSRALGKDDWASDLRNSVLDTVAMSINASGGHPNTKRKRRWSKRPSQESHT